MKIYGEELKVGRKGQCACVSYDNDAYGKFAPDQINIFVPSFMTRQLAILIAI
ncbi:MAG: hypothetical protein LBU14_05030 [Candidatus Peribacteria bacterium]|jgi:hypothetical protein|nr:hypothetical protein [Candidatus Peribacteria bacterium]